MAGQDLSVTEHVFCSWYTFYARKRRLLIGVDDGVSITSHVLRSLAACPRHLVMSSDEGTCPTLTEHLLRHLLFPRQLLRIAQQKTCMFVIFDETDLGGVNERPPDGLRYNDVRQRTRAL